MSKSFELIKQNYYKILKDKSNKILIEQLFLSIEKFEKEILLRDYIKFCLYLRISTEIIEDIIINNNALFNIKAYKSQDTNKRTIELNTLEVSLPGVANRLRWIRSKTSQYLHWDLNSKKISKLNSKIFTDTPKITETIEWMKDLLIILNKLLNMFQTKLDVSISSEVLFEDIYSQSSESINIAPWELMEYKNKTCLICKEKDKSENPGKLQIPTFGKEDKIWFQFGPYLECNYCKAILSTGLNLKRKSDKQLINLKKR